MIGINSSFPAKQHLRFTQTESESVLNFVAEMNFVTC